jgi:type I restriction enzyme S subunit
MIGQGKTRGQCAILECPAATNQNVAAIHVTKTDHSPRFVYWWLFANYQKSRATETGTAQPALSADRVKQMAIPLPARGQQEQIVAQLDALQLKVDAVKGLQTEIAAELDAMLPAILDKAFKGEL